MNKLESEIRSRILKHLANHGNKVYRPKELTRQLGKLSTEEYKMARKVIDQLKEDRKVAVHKGGRIGHRKKSGRREGRLTVHPKGFGFVALDTGGDDLFIAPGNMSTALDGDRVLVGVAARRRNAKPEGEILKVIKRGRETAVGTFNRHGRNAFVRPDDQKLVHDIFVDSEAFNGARGGDKVVVSIDDFTSPHGSPEGTVISIIGRADDPRVQVLSIALDIGVREGFDEAVDAEAEQSAVRKDDEKEYRLDLRDKRVFTIDPADAKDFDDALHIERLDNGDYEVGVHIADVSHFVRPDTQVDREARQRGTSVYLVDRVIPMLPEVLSNNACSLVPHEDRLAFSCIMRVSKEGEVKETTVVPTTIHSKHRYSYEQAQEVIERADARNDIEKDLLQAAALASQLTQNRVSVGAIDFDMPDVRVILDDEGLPIDIVLRERKASNRLIEEYMLMANKAVARLMEERFENVDFVYRIHEIPNQERIVQLAEYVKSFGYKLEHRRGVVTPPELQDLLEAFEGKPEAVIIEDATLRAMAKAVYSTDNVGHFGLAEPAYTHFTSPIRRYPDLLVHRILKQVHGYLPYQPENLEEDCKHCSERERVATNAERESVRLKQVQYVQRHVGDEFGGVISGVTNFGVFVKLDGILVEGMVHVRDMDGDYYEYDESTYTLRGSNRGKTYRPGDRVRVIVVSANVETREVDLYFAEGKE